MSRDDEFVRETRASVRQLTNGLVELERDGSSRELVDELFRTAHTLKGNCSMAGLNGASRLAHTVEDFLSCLRDGSLKPNPDLIDAALAAVDDIDASLGEWHSGDDLTIDPEPSSSALREEMDRYRDESQVATETAPESADSSDDSAGVPDEPTDEFDPTVVDALESASGFDDLEGLLAEMDDPDDEDAAGDEQARWGTFDKRESVPTDSPESNRQGDSDDATETTQETPDESEGSRETPPGKVESPSPSGSMNEFDSIKSGVEQGDVSSLDRELDEIEFGEFDHDDGLSIQQLIDGELDDEDLPDEQADTDADDVTDHPASSSATADTARRDDAIRPEDFGYESATPSTSDSGSSAGDSGSSAGDSGSSAGDSGATEPEGVTAAAGESNPFEGVDIVDPDDESGADYVSSVDMGADADTDAVTSDEPSDVRTDESDEEQPISFPDGETFGPADDEPGVAETSTDSPSEDGPEVAEASTDSPSEDGPEVAEASTDSPAETGTDSPAEAAPTDEVVADTPDFSETFEEDDSGPDEISTDDFPDEFGGDGIAFSEGDSEAASSGDVPDGDLDFPEGEFSDDFSGADAETADDGLETDVTEELPDEFADETLPDEFDDGFDLPDDFLGGDIGVGSERTRADDVGPETIDIGVASEGSTEDLDLPDIDLPDVDELTASTLGDEDDADRAATSVSFERDEHTMAFESRFAERFGGSVGDDKIQLVQVASATIEESSLDAARYQSSGTADYPLDFGDTRESDQIQSLTVDVENADSLLNLVEELSLTQLRIKQSDGEDLDDHLSVMDSVTGELRRAVMTLRLMPLSTAIDGLPRVVRDIARKQGKDVAYEVSDEGVNLDRSIVEKLGDPLVHLVRNAVDHGIEPPDERERQGKPREGSIELRAWRDRERVVIEVEDDGRGISAERIRQQAIDNDIISRERAERMSFDEVYDLVFEPGFSTAEEVTDVSGRGVGMDAVRRTVNSLDGTVDIDSEPGSGTTVRVRLPVSVAVSKMLFVGVGPEQYAIPASVVADVELVDESTLGDDGTVAVDRADEATDDSERIPYRRLSDALGVETEATGGASRESVVGDVGDASGANTPEDVPAGKRVLVRLDRETRNFALVCDEVDDAREVVVKPYEKLLGGVPGISGATMSGDGTLVNIIDVTTL
ncbi:MULTISPECIES: ATP-binding protein [Haloferax]|uniref:Chemotaxis protein CheA n=1 Tax=Haloferax marinum TaxID=2666143 RepID=A0A6A8G6E9_9EURY|nr:MULTISPECIES: ATP-binding protein [Haloferax]KAB1197172.1 hypothetical protein Hfx1150_06430 [Haloferax sp. CBA1150]MRW96208.1 hypothetical protein [Haloferax marinum]